ncbi:hypothetical protein KBF61_04175 [Candidatus Saccharibacteria bacterium]|nr:hypothetical protein [Candidatus Saccharibacteria bacterium]
MNSVALNIVLFPPENVSALCIEIGQKIAVCRLGSSGTCREIIYQSELIS